MGRVGLAEMIVVDSSALVAIAFDETECGDFDGIIRASARVLISSVTVLETKMVVHGRKGQRFTIFVDDYLASAKFEIVPPGPGDINAAYAAFVAYGKGSGHPANLNFGDMFSYALAKTRNLPLLFKGDDFCHTDIESALHL